MTYEQELYNKYKKPVADMSMLISFIGKSAYTLILPIRDISYNNTEKDIITFIVHDVGKDTKIPKDKYSMISISYSDDPEMMWAGDWADYGCYRLLFVLNKPEYKIVGNDLIIKIKRKGYDQRCTMPDRLL